MVSSFSRSGAPFTSDSDSVMTGGRDCHPRMQSPPRVLVTCYFAKQLALLALKGLFPNAAGWNLWPH